MQLDDTIFESEGEDRRGWTMVIHLGSELEAALIERARRLGIEPEILAREVLSDRLRNLPEPIQTPDEWERRLARATSDCGA